MNKISSSAHVCVISHVSGVMKKQKTGISGMAKGLLLLSMTHDT